MHTTINSLKQVAHDFKLSHIESKCNNLEHDISQDLYTFVVVGEFSSGKSTFINALINDTILPTGITPTTATINVIQYADTPSIDVYTSEGIQRIPYREHALEQFTANELTVSTIDYIEVKKPVPFLKDRVVIVDTPGLNDVNELRSVITYHYIPRADVVFYLLDCRTPLRQTEFEFITETLLRNGLEKIVFIANFADQVDEDDLNRVLERIETDLKNGTGLASIEIIPFSAIEALEREDEELFQMSGMPIVLDKIKTLCKAGTRQQEKEARYQKRLQLIEVEAVQALIELKLMLQASNEELQLQLEKLNMFKDQKSNFYKQIDDYVSERILEFQLMAVTSVRTFFAELEEEFVERVELYQGNQIEQFFGKEIPNQLKRRLKQWIERYTPHVHELLGKLEFSLTESLEETFHEKFSLVKRSGPASQEMQTHQFQMDVGRQKDPFLTSGLIVGGASTLLLVLGGPILLPILGMVGLPFLQKKMQQEQLNAVKPKVISELTLQLHEVSEQFEDEVKKYIEENAQKIKTNCLQLFEEKMEQQERAIRQQQTDIKENQTNNLMKINAIETFVNQHLNQLEEKI